MNLYIANPELPLDAKGCRTILDSLLNCKSACTYYGEGEINTVTVTRSPSSGYLVSVDFGRDDGGDYAYDADCNLITAEAGSLLHGARVVASQMLTRIRDDVASGVNNLSSLAFLKTRERYTRHQEGVALTTIFATAWCLQESF